MDLNEYRAKKQGIVTVKESIKDINAHSEDIVAIVYVGKKKNGEVVTGWSDINHTEAIGMLHVGQNEIMNDMYE